MEQIPVSGWTPVRWFPFLETQAIEDRSAALPGATLLKSRRFRRSRRPLIAPNLIWSTTVDMPDRWLSGRYMILDALTPMEGVYCFIDTGARRENGSTIYDHFATTRSLASAQRACERHHHRAPR